MIRRALLGVVLVATVLPIRSAGAITPDCTGYSEPRTLLEAQGWWVTEPDQTGTSFGHVHMATCFPLYQPVSGVVPFDLVLTLHDNPGTLFHVRPFLCRDNLNDDCVDYPEVTTDFTCSMMTCTFPLHLDLDTTGAPDGWASFRFRTEVREPDGNRLRTSNDWLVYVDNGNPVVDDFHGVRQFVGKGWYSEGGYAVASIVSGYPFPSSSGTQTVTFACGGTDTPSECLATIDPDFHAGNNGTVLYDAPGGGAHTVTIELSTLAPGNHTLAIRSSEPTCLPGGCSTRAGILKVPFTVPGVLLASSSPAMNGASGPSGVPSVTGTAGLSGVSSATGASGTSGVGSATGASGTSGVGSATSVQPSPAATFRCHSSLPNRPSPC
jgi:hypothetical protein